MGTALAGSILIAAVSASFLTNIQGSSAIPARAKEQAEVTLAGGVPFVSDADLEQALKDAGVRGRESDAAVSAYQDARVDGLKSSLAILALMAIVALLYTTRVPRWQPGAAEPAAAK
jgi:hypothetical protein